MAPKKKIIHIIQSLDNGGCENMLLRTLPLLSEYQHHIITLKELGELAPLFAEKGIPVTLVHCGGFFDIFGIFRLRKLIRKENPDTVLTYLFHADVLGRLALFGTTSVPIIPFLRTTFNHPKYLIPRIFEWLTRPLVSHYFANSDAVKDFYTKHLSVAPEKITVIPNGIATSYFDSIMPDPKLRELLGIKPNDFVIICVANLHSNKGYRYLLEAFESVYKENTNLHLLIVGDGVERDNLKNQMQGYTSKNNISFLGRRTDVPQLLKISNLFVLPTLFEGQSNALMEAMASGLPVVTTDIPENQVLIKNNSDGILVPTQNSSALIGAIQHIMSNTGMNKQLSEEAKRTIKDSFSLEKIATKWEDTLIKMTE
ncbi:glycosyltransferase [Candidatus Gracilibacteria bacterium]|nr:glycosyltransferase [Candidatus Gracilibacteria bacterium]